MGSGPEYFRFTGNTAAVPVNEQTAQMVVNHFKNYVRTTNELYARDIREQTIREEAQKRQALQEAIQRETREREINQRMNANLIW